MRSWDPAFQARISSAPNYRAFLLAFFDRGEKGRKPRPLSYQEFALRAGFASKTFMNDVVLGRKRLSPASIEKAAEGLHLTGQWREYFHALVAVEEECFWSAKHGKEYFDNRLKRARAKLTNVKPVERISDRPEIVKVFLDRNFPEVYASLGNSNAGETLANIADRSNLPVSQVAKILAKMQATGLVREKNGVYFVEAQAMEADELKGSMVFREDFFRSLEKAKRRFPHQADSNSALFMTQTLSVSVGKLPKFKQQLADLITSFADEAEESRGEVVAEILLSFTNNLGEPGSR